MARMSPTQWKQFMNDCRYKGKKAFIEGLKITANPYGPGKHCHNAWEAGYIAEQTKHLKPQS